MFFFSSQNDRITPVDVYERLWKCRDFEISHLWQRSVYLGTLLVLVAGGYGKLFECYVDVKGICIGPLPPYKYHALATCLSCIGMVVSTLWVCMAKASKAWQEKYEKAIDDFVDEFSCSGEVFSRQNPLMDTSRIAGFRFGNLTTPGELKKRDRERERNRAPWRTGGSNYSPSRINVFIGQFSWCVWFLLALSHTMLTFTTREGVFVPIRLSCVAVATAFFVTIVLCGFLTFSRNHSPITSHGL